MAGWEALLPSSPRPPALPRGVCQRGTRSRDRDGGQGMGTGGCHLSQGQSRVFGPIAVQRLEAARCQGQDLAQECKKRHSWEKRPKNWGKGWGDGEEILIVLGHSVEVLLLRGDHLPRTFPRRIPVNAPLGPADTFSRGCESLLFAVPWGGAAAFLQGSATRRARSRPLCRWKQPGLARSPHPRDAEDRGSSVPAVGGSAARWERGGEQRSRAGAGEEQGGFELPQARFRCWLDWGAKLLRGWERHLLLFIL